ncbi:MAG: 30S ribosome-binding factor RbfA [Clostridia bacterium]|nr:30S ribosome-binding factor RbfA [Clostridia bacterium]MBQ5758289.1 30S ribosome-binding factor RbfA [Clostridia bacterium]MCR5072772.1 30S ribosome-binding factor RbfA [Clostridiales bacterium]
MSAIRSDRINEEVKKTLSAIVREMKDPRISPMTTLTGAEVTKDLKYAKISVSVYDKDDAVRQGTVDALNHAAGFIAHELGQRMLIRRVPSLKFRLDDSIAYSIHISEILNSLDIKKEDGAEGETEE